MNSSPIPTEQFTERPDQLPVEDVVIPGIDPEALDVLIDAVNGQDGNEEHEVQSSETQPRSLENVFEKFKSNPLLTEASKAKRQEYERLTNETLPQLEKKFPDYEFVMALSGSVQFGLAREDSDIDIVYYVRRKDKEELAAATPDELYELQSQTQNGTVMDINQILNMCKNGPIYVSPSLEIGYFEDPETDEYWQGNELDPAQQMQNELFGASGSIPYHKLAPISMLFAPTSEQQEQNGALVHQWRREIFQTISNRPDAEVLWDAVRESWKAQYTMIERNTLASRDRLGKFKDALETTAKERWDKDLSPEDIEARMKKLDRYRREITLPDFETMRSEYEISN